MRVYCIDTSALIDGWKDYPQSILVLDEIQKLINDERFLSPYHVLGELKVKEDDLYKWCNEKDLTFVVLLQTQFQLRKRVDFNILDLILKKVQKQIGQILGLFQLQLRMNIL